MAMSDYEFVRHEAEHIMLNSNLLQGETFRGAPDGQNSSTVG